MMVDRRSLQVRATRLMRSLALWALTAVMILFAGGPEPALAGQKNRKDQTPAAAPVARPKIDTASLVWPDPPDIPRIRWLAEYRGEPESTPAQVSAKKQAKQRWMERLAGIQPASQQRTSLKFKLIRPYGVAVNSKGDIFAADTYVGAVFIFRAENGKVDFIRNGREARFKGIIGLAMDDNDRLFVTDTALRQVFVFDAGNKLITTFGLDRLVRPSGIALDVRNRFVYITDTDKNNVSVYDADSFRYLRTIGGPPKNPGDQDPGTFAKPTNVAVDREGNVYVSDLLNNRIQIFDPDGGFLSMFGKPGDGPADFTRPKGIAVDSDGHIWVTDSDQNRVKVFDRQGHLCAFFGEYGYLPGQFTLPAGIAIDRLGRVVVAEQVLNGRLQVFRYYTDAEANAEKAKREPGNGGAVSRK